MLFSMGCFLGEVVRVLRPYPHLSQTKVESSKQPNDSIMITKAVPVE